MEVIISANQNILAMANNFDGKIDERMSEELYWQWVRGVSKDGLENENRLQEISV